MKDARALAVSLCIAVAAGCAGTSFDAAAETALLLKRDAEWANLAATSHDVEQIVSYWSDDAIVIPPREPAIEGKAALREFVTASKKIPGFTVHWVSDHVSFSPDGKVAYMRSANQTTLNGPDGRPMTFPGRAITVWRKDADGQWRCVVDIWNEPPPSKTPTS